MTDQNPLAETERFLHEKIPLSLAMAVRVESLTADVLVLTAPLGPNHNHLGTAFGGSLGALALLAGYAMLWLEIQDRDCHIVVRSSTLDYRRPVRGQLRAVCRKPGEEELAHLKETFRRKGKARIHLRVDVVDNEVTCVAFEGVFVILRHSSQVEAGIPAEL
jgi:thioesterase domain-containing protein